MQMIGRSLLGGIALLALAGCASLPQRDAPQVQVSGIEPLQGQGLELRMLVKLRVQNPNDAPIDYDGVYVKLDVQGKTFATGVSDARGSVPRFGEAILQVPVTVSAFRMARQVIGAVEAAASDAVPQKIRYSLTGKLSGSGFGGVRFSSQGEMGVPGTGTASASGAAP